LTRTGRISEERLNDEYPSFMDRYGRRRQAGSRTACLGEDTADVVDSCGDSSERQKSLAARKAI